MPNNTNIDTSVHYTSERIARAYLRSLPSPPTASLASLAMPSNLALLGLVSGAAPALFVPAFDKVPLTKR